jgi:hypothetical protein
VAAACASGRAQGPIDTCRPFELELFCVPAEEECSDTLLPYGCGLYGSVDPDTIDAFRHVCDTPARRLITSALYDGSGLGVDDIVTDDEEESASDRLHISQAFGFIRAHEDEPFPIGTLAVANELRIGGFEGILGQVDDDYDDDAGGNGITEYSSRIGGRVHFALPPNHSARSARATPPLSLGLRDSARSSRAAADGAGENGGHNDSLQGEQRASRELQPALFSYYGLARFQLLDLVETPASSPYPVGLVQLFHDREPEAPASKLLELEAQLVSQMREFLRLNSFLALASSDDATAELYDDRLGELDALLAECRRGPTRVDSRWGKRHELVSFFVCDHLTLSPDERARLIRLRDSEVRLRFALEHMGPMVAELAALSSLARTLSTRNMNL